MREDGALGCAGDGEEVVLDDAARLRPPVGEDVGRGAARHVVEGARQEVARPRVVEVHRPLGERLVVGDLDLDVADVRQLLEVFPGLGDDLRVLGVEVGDPALGQRVPLHRHREPVALVVQEADPAAPLRRVPEDLPGDVQPGDVHGDEVVAPADAVRPGDVRHGVVRAAVVERVGERRPDVGGQVRQVGVVERLQELQRHQVHDVRAREADDDVVLDGARLQLGDRLVRGVVRRQLDLAVVRTLEAAHELRVQVVRIVEEPQRGACLGRQLVGDRRVVLDDRPRDAVVRARERQPGRAHGLWDDERRARLAGLAADRDGLGCVLAPDQPSRHPDARGGHGGAAEQLSTGQPRSVLRMGHARRKAHSTPARLQKSSRRRPR